MKWGLRILVLFLLVPVLAGCWSNRPVELRALVLAIGFSPAPHHHLRVTIQMPTQTGLTTLTKSSGGSSGNGKLIYTVAGDGSTPGMALTRIQSHLQTDLYLGQIQLVVFSRRLEPMELRLAEDYLTRLAPMDKTAYVIATPSVSKLLQMEPKAGQIPTLNLIGGFGCKNCETVTYRQHQWDVEMAIPTPGDSLWMPYVTPTTTGFDTGRILLYRGFKPVWALSTKDTLFFGMLLGRTGKGYISFRAHDQMIGIRTIKALPKVSARSEAGHLALTVRVRATGTLDSWSGSYLTPATIEAIDRDADDYLATHLMRVLQRAQADGAVPNGWLAPLIWRSHPNWRGASVWEDQYRHADLTVQVQFHLINVGDSN